MKEFIEELKFNRNINISKNLENRIDIDYIIERLENIQAYLLNNIEYFDYHNKNLNKKQDEKIDNIKENLTDAGVFKKS